MATETTPLRDGEPRRPPPIPDHQRRLAGLAVFALVMVAVAVLSTTSFGHKTQVQPKPQPVKATHEQHQSPLNITKPTPAPKPKDWFRCGTGDSEAGYITPANNENNHLFYWFFESRSEPTKDPLVLWLTGSGPSCSSLSSLLVENGPCRVNADLSTALNPNSWTTAANVIWLDQPGVGFSYSDVTSDDTEKDVQETVYWFLQGFLDKHPELEGRSLFLAGEGLASHAIPAVAHYIWSENRVVKVANATIRINLEGISIGNGLVNPLIQIPHALDMATKNPYNVSLLNDTQLKLANAAVPVCEGLIRQCQTSSDVCIESASYCSNSLLDGMTEAHRNTFDIRKKCVASDPADCYNTTLVSEYLNSTTVRAYLNVSDHAPVWATCSSNASTRFPAEVMKNSDGYISNMLNDGSVRVLVYNGDADVVCNWYGSRAWTQQLEWKHQDAFNKANAHDFLVPGEKEMVAAGSTHSFGTQFSFVRVFKAGHLVPLDQPFAALEMINRFIRNQEI